jgi:hypothetical protein
MCVLKGQCYSKYLKTKAVVCTVMYSCTLSVNNGVFKELVLLCRPTLIEFYGHYSQFWDTLHYKGDFFLNFYDSAKWKFDSYLVRNDQHFILEWCFYMLRKLWPEVAFFYETDIFVLKVYAWKYTCLSASSCGPYDSRTVYPYKL